MKSTDYTTLHQSVLRNDFAPIRVPLSTSSIKGIPSSEGLPARAMLPSHETAPRWLIAALLHGWDSALPQGSASEHGTSQTTAEHEQRTTQDTNRQLN